ncbi:hypothetical protein [Larkinella rosea]|uniref:DUF3999 family protein n=1 Tax=Larkinella rosea TaxID=2025312 RepID=A0A3P1BJ42_9BACT|nr:hypothetical protein [Larkinella rosea]RRB01111.1 hypothetical protein EHT25_23335 [Larkinella rosea]
MRPRSRFLSCTILLVVAAFIGRAQSFGFRAEIPAVQKTGYYRILLPPAVVGQLKADRSDIRLFDEKKQEIPYILNRDQPNQKVQFNDYELVSKITSAVSTKLVLRNGNRKPISSLGLIIKNTNLRKKARLSGSNDAQTWYGIEDNYLLEPVASTETTSEARIIGFPLSDYAYYQLEINDSLSAPLNILKVGYYTTTTDEGQYSAIPGVSFAQKEQPEDHKSQVRIAFNTLSRPDKLTISVDYPVEYRRRVELAERRTWKTKRRRLQTGFETLKTFELNSIDSLHTVLLPNLQTNELYLLIENQNNQPLKIGAIQAWQLNTYVVAELQPGNSYHFALGNPAVGAPTYDLPYFKDKIPGSLPSILALMPTPVAVSAASSPSFFAANPWVIWVAIGLVLALLSYFSYQMITDLKNR